MTATPPDRPAILVFPPLVPLAVLLLGLLLQWLLPLGLLAQIAPPGRHIVGALAFAAGFALIVVANRHFRRIGTNARPTLPTLASLPLLHYGIVRREEAYLEAKFGEPYRRYKAAVPRYGWKARSDDASSQQG
jgi:protein-S-isoprenylcysteine O-methyltransferase Ste14